MEKQIKERNYWPHGIVISIILIIIACAVTIKIALDNPVQMDSFYMQKYQDVDRNMHKIEQKQKLFFERFEVAYEDGQKVMGKPFDVSFSIKDNKTNLNLQDATITLLLTRPNSNEFNKEFQFDSAKNGKYKVENVTVNKPGRWQFLAKIKYKEYEGFHKHEVLVIK